MRVFDYHIFLVPLAIALLYRLFVVSVCSITLTTLVTVIFLRLIFIDFYYDDQMTSGALVNGHGDLQDITTQMFEPHIISLSSMSGREGNLRAGTI